MKRLITDVYRILYRMCRNQEVSAIGAIVYVAMLNVIMLYGLCTLLESWQKEFTYIVRLLSMPYAFLIATVGMVLVNLYIMFPFEHLPVITRRRHSVMPAIVYSFSSLLLFLYVFFI